MPNAVIANYVLAYIQDNQPRPGGILVVHPSVFAGCPGYTVGHAAWQCRLDGT